MKKIVLLVALVAVSFGAVAQNFSYGIKAGMNVSTIGGKDIKEINKNKVGWFAGIATEVKVSKKFSIAPELLYSNQGLKMDAEDEGVGTTKFHTLNLPIFAKYYITKNLSVAFGPQFGYAIKGKIKLGDESMIVEKEDYNAFDFALGVGVGYKFGNMFVDARYNYGLTNVLKDINKNNNRVFQLGVGYMF